jgi:hypothetical protein
MMNLHLGAIGAKNNVNTNSIDKYVKMNAANGVDISLEAYGISASIIAAPFGS